MLKTYHIKTFGCQMNVSDSERIAGFLESLGLRPIANNKLADLSAEALAQADLVVFNTCGVRQMAENRAYGQIHNLKKNNSAIKIVLTGCLANRKDVQRRLKDKVDLFFPINEFGLFENFIIENSFKIKNLKLKIPALQNARPFSDYLSINPKYNSAYTALVPVMSGCNNFCSYCVVPYARGPETSRPATEIITEIKSLIKNGCKSITLLGQNVNSYLSPSPSQGEGGRRPDEVDFSQLLKKINAIPGKFWIHFVSSHPKDMSDELIEAVARCKKVCEVVHLPIQSGSDEILRQMNRKYTAQQYMSLVRKIKSAFKQHKSGVPFALTSDIIVGFPGETEEQFLSSAEMMEKAKYDMVFFGQYSPRPGTAAWNMKDDVTKDEKERREQFLNEILKKATFANNKKYINTLQEVLIEKESEGFYFGKTRTLKNVKIISTRKSLIGEFVKVKITKANIWNLEGVIE